jgi:hypothetical protein
MTLWTREAGDVAGTRDSLVTRSAADVAAMVLELNRRED